MKNYFANKSKSIIICLDEDENIEVFNFIRGIDEITITQEDLIEPEKTIIKVTGSDGTKKVSTKKKDSKGTAKTPEEKAAYNREWYLKKKAEKEANKAQGYKKPKTEPVVTGNNEEGEPLFQSKAVDLPVTLVNKYGRTTVEVVRNEKNRGIGFTAEEIFFAELPALKNLSEVEITEIVEGLEEAFL